MHLLKQYFNAACLETQLLALDAGGKEHDQLNNLNISYIKFFRAKWDTAEQ